MNRQGKGWHGESTRHSLASHGVKTTLGKSKVQQFRQDKNVPPEELYLEKGQYRKTNIDKIIKLFWWCSYTNNWQWFNFEEAFNLAKDILYEKLGNHFRLPPDEQKEYMRRLQRTVGEMLYGRHLNFFVHYISEILSTSDARDVINTLFTQEVKQDIKSRILPRINKNKDGDEINFNEYKNNVLEGMYPLHDEMELYSFQESYIDLVSSNMIHPNSEYEKIFKKYKELKNISNLKQEEKVILFDSLVHLEHHNQEEIFSEYIIGRIPDIRKDFEEEYL